MPEKRQTGQRHWEGKYEEQQAVYANRRRVNGAYVPPRKVSCAL